MTPREIAFLSSEELHAAYVKRALSPVEVMRVVLDRVEMLNPKLNVFCTLLADEALDAAAESERRYRHGRQLGALDGVPVSVKDHVAVRGARMTLGSKVRGTSVPDYDSPAVERMKAAGCLIFAKTNMPEYGWKGVTDNTLFGITRNPWDLDLTPGGSTGGAAAVAAGMGPITHGGDGAGSIRIPAAFCGVFGLKPSFGRIPQYPRGGTESISHDGPLSRTVIDAAMILDVVSVPDDRDRNSLPSIGFSYADRTRHAADEFVARRAVVAWSPDLGYATVDPEVARAAERAARRFEQLGCHVQEIHPNLSDPFSILEPLYLGAMGGALRAHYRDPSAQMDPDLVTILKRGEAITAYDYGAAVIERAAFYERIRALMDRFDLLLTPATSTLPFPVGRVAPETISGVPPTHFFSWTPFTYPFNLTGQPAASIPIGLSANGLPIGLQIVGKRHDDLTVLQAAKTFEAAFPWAHRIPPIS